VALPLHRDPALAGFSASPGAERRVSEPALVIPAETLEAWRRARPAAVLAASALPDFAASTHIPLAGAATKAGTSRFWKVAIVVSMALHAAAGLFLLSVADDEALIAGGEQAQVALLGNAAEDQLSAGDTAQRDDAEVTSVTIVPLVQAQPVETVDAQPVEAEPVAVADTDILQPVDPLQPIEMADRDAVEPVPSESAPPVEANSVTPDTPTPVKASEWSVPVPSIALDQVVEPVDQPAVAASDVPEVLTAEPAQAERTANVVPIPAAPAQQVAPAPVAQAAPAPAEIAVAEPVMPAPPNAETISPVEEVAPQPPVANRPKEKANPAPKAAPIAKARQKPEAAREAKSKPAPAKQAKLDAKAKPAKVAASAAGAKGKNKTDARRGDADGSKDGRSTGKNKGAKQNSAGGNSSITNYPGKIVSKLRRALRYPAAARSQGLRGEVQVSFTVSASGGVGGIRVVSSSGSPVLDKAAVETVRRAAPFPPIPDGAGRSSWPFTVPLAFTR